MDTRLIALKLFKSTPDVISGVAAKTEFDYQDIAVSIFLKFIDVLEGAAVIAAGYFLVRFLKRYFEKAETAHERQRTALNLLEKIVDGFILVIAVTLGLKIIGLDLTLIVGVLTLGLSFGMRDVIKNYVAGLLILFKSPFEIGDIVKIRNFIGRVEKIEFQAVTVRGFDHKQITIHNSDLLTQPITNFSKSEQMRLELSMLMGYGSDIEKALKIFDAILRNNSSVLKSPKYSIVFREFENHGTRIYIRFWVKRPCNPLKMRSEIALKIQEAFDEERIFAPYNREASLNENFGMSEGRRERLKLFYGQPALSEIAAQTLEKIAVAANGNGNAQIAPAAAEEYPYDAEEPE